MKTWCLVVGLSLFALGCNEGGSGRMETDPQASPAAPGVPGAEGGGGVGSSGPVGGPGPSGTGITP
jgi:hypothetical protein